jgi:DNA-binding transcriptional LysR family regulator
MRLMCDTVAAVPVPKHSVTRRLQRLETSLGATLFDRRTRPVMLTAAGEAALGSCRRLINDVREVRTAIGTVMSPSARFALESRTL